MPDSADPSSRPPTPDRVPPDEPADRCDVCGSEELEWRSCKLICRNCRTILKSCSDL